MITRVFVKKSSPFVLAFLLLCPLFMGLAFVPLGRCRTLSVPSEDYPTIQAAVENATDGDTILVLDGTYTEGAYVESKSLTLRSEQGPNGCIVDAPITFMNATNSKIIGFTVNEIMIENSPECSVSNNIIFRRGPVAMDGSLDIRNSPMFIFENNVFMSYSDQKRGGLLLRSGCESSVISLNNMGNGAITLQNSSNSIISHNANCSGIELSGMNDNTVTYNEAGQVDLSSCSNNVVSNNTKVMGICIDSGAYCRVLSINNIVSNNELTAGDIVVRDAQFSYIYSNAIPGIVEVVSSSDVAISNNNMSGIILRSGSNTTTVSNNIVTSGGGIEIGDFWSGSTACTISNNLITDNAVGIELENASRCALKNNLITANDDGIIAGSSSDNEISYNTISNNNNGGVLLQDGSTRNTLSYNRVESNRLGIYTVLTWRGDLWSNSSYNLITYNDLVNNTGPDPFNPQSNITRNAEDPNANTWDYNLYSDYAGIDADGDGIGDTPHPISRGLYPGGGMTDPHPRIYRANPTAELNLTCRLAKSFLTFGEAIEIEGNVTDESDNPVISAEVKLTIVFSNGTVLDPQSVTDAAGNFALNYAVQPTDPQGAYGLTIVASKGGVSGRFVTTVNVYGMRGAVYSRVHDANGVLADTTFECNLTIMYKDGTRKRLTTDQMGKFDLTRYIVDASGTVSPGVHTIFIENQQNDTSEYFSRWGTRNILPIHGLNRDGPMLRAMFNGPLSTLTTSVTLTTDVWVKNETGSIVRVKKANVDVKGGLLEIFVMTLEELEKLARWEVARLSKDAGVDITVPLETQIRYGVSKWFSSDWMGEYDPSNGEIRIEKAGDEVFSGIDKNPEQLTIWMHEMGHRVKDSRLHDPDADLGGPHDNEDEPGRNVEQAYDEGFACFFAALALDYSAEFDDSGHGYDNTAYYWGPVSQGTTGNWVEGRVAGIILSLYDIQVSWSTASRKDALEDFFTKSDAFSFLMGRYPRTIDEWLYIKYALQPSIYGKLEALASRAQYYIEIFDCDLLVDNTGAAKRENSEGVLRFSDSEYVAFTTRKLNLQLESPSNLDPPGESNTLAGRITVLPLKRDNLTTTSSDPNVVWIKKVGTADPNRPFVGWMSIQMKNPSELRFTPSANELEINGVGEVFLISHNKSPQTAQFTIKFSGTTVTLNSEVLIKLGSDGRTEITVFRGHVEVSGDYWTREIAPEGTVAADGAGSILSEGKTELTTIERWWIDLIPKPYVVDHALCKDVTQDGAPVEETSTFTAEDQVYCSLNLANVSAGDLVRWIFRGPNGVVSEASGISNSSGNAYFWNMLDLKDHDSADVVGNWTLSVYMSEEETVTDEFTVQPQSNLNAWAIIMTIITRTDFLIATALSSIALVTLIILVSRRKPKQ